MFKLNRSSSKTDNDTPVATVQAHTVFYMQSIELISKIHEIAQNQGVPYNLAPSLREAVQSGEARNWSVFIELEDLAKIDFLMETVLSFEWQRIVLISRLSAKNNIQLMHRYPKVKHLVPVDHLDFEDQLIKLFHEIKESEKQNEMRPGDSTNPTQDFASVKRLLTNSSQRHECLDSMENYAKQVKAFRNFVPTIRTIASELVTNAFFNGPVEKENLKLSRKTDVFLQEDQSVEFEYGHNGREFWIRVVDPFGSLRKNSVISNLIRTTSTEKAEVREDQSGGAGVGLFLVYNSVSELSFKLMDGVKTEIICKIPMVQRQKHFDQVTPSIHFSEVTE